MIRGMEALEGRRLCTVSIAGSVGEHISLARNGALTVIGSAHPDRISIKPVGVRYRVGVDDGVMYFTTTRIHSISVSGGLGDDLISEKGPLQVTISGGGGNDSLTAGSSGDVLSGDDGNDTLLGGDGNDTLAGGNGNDLIDGGAGDNSADGGDGDDDIIDG